MACSSPATPRSATAPRSAAAPRSTSSVASASSHLFRAAAVRPSTSRRSASPVRATGSMGLTLSGFAARECRAITSPSCARPSARPSAPACHARNRSQSCANWAAIARPSWRWPSLSPPPSAASPQRPPALLKKRPPRSNARRRRRSMLEHTPPTTASLCVLSSSSRGNCSVLALESAGHRRVVLIDAGLSPRRTRRLLAEVGLTRVPIDAILLTHLDSDHFYPTWLGALADEASIHLHRRHRGRARREGLLRRRTEVFDEAFDLAPGVVVHPRLLEHDSLGVAVFRFEFTESRRSLGFATDVGRPTRELVSHLSGVDVLAIESNYCPVLEEASDRPRFLKDRIMGGSGHLSNQQCRQAIAAIAPRERVVLLHLSPQCNRPALARAEHAEGRYELVISSMNRPTPWIPLTWPGAPAGAPVAPRQRQQMLWPVAAMA